MNRAANEDSVGNLRTEEANDGKSQRFSMRRRSTRGPASTADRADVNGAYAHSAVRSATSGAGIDIGDNLTPETAADVHCKDAGFSIRTMPGAGDTTNPDVTQYRRSVLRRIKALMKHAAELASHAEVDLAVAMYDPRRNSLIELVTGGIPMGAAPLDSSLDVASQASSASAPSSGGAESGAFVSPRPASARGRGLQAVSEASDTPASIAAEVPTPASSQAPRRSPPRSAAKSDDAMRFYGGKMGLMGGQTTSWTSTEQPKSYVIPLVQHMVNQCAASGRGIAVQYNAPAAADEFLPNSGFQSPRQRTRASDAPGSRRSTGASGGRKGGGGRSGGRSGGRRSAVRSSGGNGRRSRASTAPDVDVRDTTSREGARGQPAARASGGAASAGQGRRARERSASAGQSDDQDDGMHDPPSAGRMASTDLFTSLEQHAGAALPTSGRDGLLSGDEMETDTAATTWPGMQKLRSPRLGGTFPPSGAAAMTDGMEFAVSGAGVVEGALASSAQIDEVLRTRVDELGGDDVFAHVGNDHAFNAAPALFPAASNAGDAGPIGHDGVVAAHDALSRSISAPPLIARSSPPRLSPSARAGDAADLQGPQGTDGADDNPSSRSPRFQGAHKRSRRQRRGTRCLEEPAIESTATHASGSGSPQLSEQAVDSALSPLLRRVDLRPVGVGDTTSPQGGSSGSVDFGALATDFDAGTKWRPGSASSAASARRDGAGAGAGALREAAPRSSKARRSLSQNVQAAWTDSAGTPAPVESAEPRLAPSYGAMHLRRAGPPMPTHTGGSRVPHVTGAASMFAGGAGSGASDSESVRTSTEGLGGRFDADKRTRTG